MSKVGFIVPVKAKKVSKDWDWDNRLLERTLNAMINQTNDNFVIYLVYTDLPDIDIDLNSNKIKLIRFSGNMFDLDKMKNINVARKYFKREDYIHKLLDKTQRVFLAIESARLDKCKYVIPIDSDDIVSNRIVEYVDKNSNDGIAAGWFFNKGYLYEEGSNFLLHQDGINCITAGAYVIRIDLCPLPIKDSPDFKVFDFFESHRYLKVRLKKEHNVVLEPIPFHALIYIVHNFNTSEFKDRLNANRIKKIIKFFIRGRVISKKIKSEFSFYKLSN